MTQTLQISPVRRTHGPLLFLWPVQSSAQFASFVLSCAAILTLMAIALRLWAPQWMSPPLVLLCAALGATWSLHSVLPAKIELTTRGEARHFVKEVAQVVTEFHYANGVPTGAGPVLRLHFVHKGPRWQHVPESDIMLTAQDHTIELRGPIVLLSLIQRRLAKDAARHCGQHA